MIKKLRFKFILVSMLSILFVLAATIGGINTYNYVKIESDSQISLSQILSEGVVVEQFGPGGGVVDNPSNPPEEGGKNPGGDKTQREGLMGEHYFIVAFDSNGTITKSNFRHIFSVTESEGQSLAQQAYSGEISGGKYNDFRYAISSQSEDGTTYVAFIDIREKMITFNSFLVTSLIISASAYAVLLVLIVLASKIVFKTSEESYRKQKSFITNASHELKTPLTIINTDLEIIEMDSGKSEWSESIRDQVKRLTTMTNQLVTLSKLEEDDMKNYPFVDFSVSDLAKQAVEAFAPSFEKQGFNFEYDIEENVMLHGNKYLVDELFYIFLDNALKYAKEAGRVRLETKKGNKKEVNIIFSNNIDDNAEIDTSLLFDRFYRSPTAKKQGSGIGLSIANEIVKLHKGSIKANIKDNQIFFYITL